MAGPTTYVTVLIPLPIFYNAEPGEKREPMEDEKFMATADEIAREFGGGTLHVFREGKVEGFWWDRNVVDRDVLALLEVDIADTDRNRAWLKSYARAVLVKRFRQKAIYVKFVGPVETLLVTEEEATE